jgi:uncharacterized protein
MKYLLLLLIVLAGIWWIRQQRKPHQDMHAQHKASTGPQTMLPCAHCGTHVPERDAIAGRHGVYCSEPHRQRQEG